MTTTTLSRAVLAAGERHLRPVLALALAVAGLWSAMPTPASAQGTLPDQPLATARAAAVKPNIMLLMDTSKSMAYTHMPDDLEGVRTQLPMGYSSHQCNVLYYNPNETYKIPKGGNKLALPTPSFTAAPYDYYLNPTGTTINLSTSFQPYDPRTTSRGGSVDTYETLFTRNGSTPSVTDARDNRQAAYYYVYTGSAVLTPTTAPCTQPDVLSKQPSGSTAAATGSAGGTWTRVNITGEAAQNNFAIWYTYYRTRMALIKSGVSLAFSSDSPDMDNRYRIGLVSMNPYSLNADGSLNDTSTIQAGKYQALAPFDGNQRVDWFNRLFGQTPEGASPAREGLARVGRHYAGKTDSINSGMPIPDGVSAYACQQNFTIMTTDGYWNTTNESPNGGPVGLDGTTWVGNTDSTLTEDDGNSPRPIWDGNVSSTVSRTDQANEYRFQSCGGFWYVTEVRRRMRSIAYEQREQQVQQYQTRWIRETEQLRQSTSQYMEDITQYLRTRTQRTVSTFQTRQTNSQWLESTRRYIGGGTNRTETRTTTVYRTVTQPQQTETQLQQRQYKIYKSTLQRRQTQYYDTKTTKQQQRLVLKRQKQTEQITFKRYRTYQSTAQTLQYSYYVTAVATQHWAYNGQTETATPIENMQAAVCSNANYYCYKLDVVNQEQIASNVTPSPTRVASCENATPSSGNGWLTRNCNTVVVTAQNTPVQTCTAAGATSSNNYVTTTCTPNNTSNVLVNSCTAGAATSGNSWTTTTCSVTYLDGSASAGVPAETCTNQTASNANGSTTIACTTNTSNWTGVNFNACTADEAKSSSNNWTKTTCRVVNNADSNQRLLTPTSSVTWPTPDSPGSFSFSNVTSACSTTTNFPNVAASTAQICGVRTTTTTQDASCTASTSGGATVTCARTTLQDNVPVNSCTASNTVTGGNRVFTTCADNNTAETAVDACTNEAKSSTNQYTQTVCRTNIESTTGVEPGTCTARSPNSGNGFVGIECFNYSNTQFVQTCTAQTGGSGNQWLTRTCSTANNSGPTAVDPATCTNQTGNAGNSWRTIVCDTQTTAWTTAAFGCTAANPSSPDWVRTECRNVVVTNPTTPQGNACTQTQIDNGTCTTVYTNNVPVQQCTYGEGITEPSVGNNQTWYNCVRNYPNSMNDTPVQSCTAVTATSTNNWVTTTCNQNDTGPTPVLYSACSNGTTAASSTNSWTRTVCETKYTSESGVTQDNAPVAACTNENESSSNSYVRTRCTDNSSSRGVQSCTVGTVTTAQAVTTCRHVVTTDVLTDMCTPQTATGTNSWLGITCSSTTTGPDYVASCTPSAATAPNYIRTDCREDSANNYPTAPVGVQSCTPGTDSNSVTTVCVPRDTGFVPVASCQYGTGTTPGASGNQWITTTCQLASGSQPTFTLVSSCTPQQPTQANGYRTVECEVTRTPDPNVQPYTPNVATSCTTRAATSANGFTAIECQAVSGNQLQYQGRTTRTVSVMSGAVVARQTTSVIATQAWQNIGSCVAPNVTVTLPADGRPADGASPTPASVYASLGANAATISPELQNCATWANCVNDTPSSTTSRGNSLADVAQYYYATDLRPDSRGQVTPKRTGKEDDRVDHQHMTTFVMGLGVSGTLAYRDDYKTATTGDFARIRDPNDPFNWPTWPPAPQDPDNPKSNAGVTEYERPESIDDFWHTAVNGRGQFFSAGKPDTVIAGLSSALNAILVESGAGNGATTSTLAPVAGDNAAYIATFTTQLWSGELEARTLNTTTGVLSGTSRWQAATELEKKLGASCDNRDIRVFRSTAANKLAQFASSNSRECNNLMQAGDLLSSTKGAILTNTEINTYFNNATVVATQLSQFDPVSTGANQAQKDAAAANLVNYLRGQHTKEDYLAGNVERLYRKRDKSLGTIVGSQPLYVRKAPTLEYSDSGYQQFKTTQQSSTATRAMVYVGGNDGMLHAFEESTGNELWAFVPTAVMPKMAQLASVNYGHKFLVDGTPISGDVYDTDSNTWKTIIVGGLNAGGRSYYALDVTNPAEPKGLWEFSGGTGKTCHANRAAAIGQAEDCDLGYSFGRPVITKLANGTWVVLLTSGYNNTSPGDGKNHLFVINAVTGRIIDKITTNIGHGLREINTYVANIAANNTAMRVYGGDLDGNIWRFDVNDNLAPAGTEATRVGTATDADGVGQPITTRIALAELGGYTMLYVGTGQLLREDDLRETATQSVYGFRDTAIGASTDGIVGDIAYANLRTALKPLQMVKNEDTGNRTIECASDQSAVCALTLGWRVDLPDSGERVSIDVQTALGTLVFTSNVPFGDNACNVGGSSYLNYLSMLTGEAVRPASDGSPGIVSVPLTNSLNVGLGLIILPSGQVIAVTRGSDGVVSSKEVPVSTPGPEGRRISWREVTQ